MGLAGGPADPDLLAVLQIRTAEEATALLAAARNRLAVAGIRKRDAPEAFQWLIQGGLLPKIRAGRLCGILGTRTLPWRDGTIDLSPPWKRLRVTDAVAEAVGVPRAAR